MDTHIVVPAKPDTIDELLINIKKRVASGEAFAVTMKGFAERSLSQNALFHVWVRDYASLIFQKPTKDLSNEEQVAMKISLKQECYLETDWQFLVVMNRNVFRGKEKIGLASSADYSTGEMFQFMEWVQGFAVRKHKLILESKGEFATLKEQQYT